METKYDIIKAKCHRLREDLTDIINDMSDIDSKFEDILSKSDLIHLAIIRDRLKCIKIKLYHRARNLVEKENNLEAT